jgi:hypothetical protein
MSEKWAAFQRTQKRFVPTVEAAVPKLQKEAPCCMANKHVRGEHVGFYFRKSFGKGPIRLNLSKSGLGVSVGVKGARVSFGPRGTFLHAGRGGVYYRQRLTPPPSRGAAPRTSSAGPQPMAGSLHTMGTADLSDLHNCSGTELLQTINQRAQAVPYAWLVGGLLSLLTLVIGTAMAPAGPEGGGGVVTVTLVLITAIVTTLTARSDQNRRTTLLEYRLPPDAARRFVTLQRALVTLARSQAIWRVTGQQQIWNHKWQAGANEAIARHPVTLRPGIPPQIETNLQVQCLDLGDPKLYFFPDQVLIYQRGRYGALGYDTLTLAVGGTRFVEVGILPGDARVIEMRWLHMNKDGNPDRRFAQNPQVPVAGYATLALQSASGLDVRLMLSGVDAVGQFLQMLSTVPAPCFRIVRSP